MKKHRDLFMGFKTSRAIPIRSVLTHDFLVQCTLDSGVCCIDYQPVLLANERVVAAPGVIILERTDGRYAVDLVVDGRRADHPAAEALLEVAFARNCAGIIEVTAADIRAEPCFSSAREVWSHRTVHLHGDDRAEILGVLEREGPTAFGRLLEDLILIRGEPRPTIYAMACEGSVCIDLRHGLGADAVIRAGRFGYSTALRAFGT